MRLKLHLFVLSWLCLVALPGLLSAPAPHHASGADAVARISRSDKVLRPEVGSAAAAVSIENRSGRASPRPEPLLITANLVVGQTCCKSPAGDALGRDVFNPSEAPYSPRAPPIAHPISGLDVPS